MKEVFFSGEHVPFEVDLRIHSDLHKYRIQPDIDDVNSLRAYFVIVDLESKANDKSNWIFGFLVCASIWALHASGGPFSLTTELFNYFGWSRNVAIVSNIALLILFWFLVYFFVTGLKERTESPWQATDEEFSDLSRRIREMKNAQKAYRK